ncbi:uncharacterized protein LOC133325404, partial [Musca vetustissima]|uniref:uncharacterized protein LOC133325404 n=1 Tax=Musca vetustissima TaxID=27455 RepID=UPI002AB63750
MPFNASFKFLLSGTTERLHFPDAFLMQIASLLEVYCEILSVAQTGDSWCEYKSHPTVLARNTTPVAYPGSPLHLSVEFCANPPAHAARWLHGERVYTPGNQYGNTVLAYGFTDLPTPFCKEARLTYVSMHERVPRTFYFIVSSPGGVAEAVIKVNFTLRYRPLSNVIDEEEEELRQPEEIHFPKFGNPNGARAQWGSF